MISDELGNDKLEKVVHLFQWKTLQKHKILNVLQNASLQYNSLVYYEMHPCNTIV